MSDDKTVITPVEIPGMQITFQGPIGPDGKGMTFVLSADALISLPVLNERLDVVAASLRRQDAFEQLEKDRQSLAGNTKLLAKQRALRSLTQRSLEAKVEAAPATRHGGRKPDATQVAPSEVSTLSQYDQRIMEIEGQIVECQ